jgi:hypothetical protein
MIGEERRELDPKVNSNNTSTLDPATVGGPEARDAAGAGSTRSFMREACIFS